ncbi:MAG TPA: hypothetical protein VFH47_09215 [Candidatus Thermoplasmatota archaeon]|nr:hypothetical protein [Candidatus Thermoplasmatota archaeon]
MPSFLIHSLIPLLLLLAWRRLDARVVWTLWPLSHLSDLDYFIGYHRATFSSVFILLPGFALAWWSRLRKPSLVTWGLVANAYLGSHLVMDMLTGGIVPLYPLSTWRACYYLGVEVITATNTPRLDAGDCSGDGIPHVAEVYPWLDHDEAAILAVLLAAAMVALARAWHLRTMRRKRSHD